MTVANLASPITPFSSTIRPWTSLVCKITVSFSSLLIDSAGADGVSAGATASEVAEVSGTAGLSTGAGVADGAGVATTAELSAGVVASSAYTCPAKKAGANRAVDKTGNKERLFILKSLSFLFLFYIIRYF